MLEPKLLEQIIDVAAVAAYKSSLLKGKGDKKGWFEIAFLPYFCTQKTVNYTHNGKDIINFDLKCLETFPIR